MNITLPNGNEVPLEKIRKDFKRSAYVNGPFSREIVLALCQKVKVLTDETAINRYREEILAQKKRISDLEGYAADPEAAELKAANRRIADLERENHSRKLCMEQNNRWRLEDKMKLALWREFFDFVNEVHLGAIQLAWVHGWRCPQEDVEKGREYRRGLGIDPKEES